jgi:hypothetical protein
MSLYKGIRGWTNSSSVMKYVTKEIMQKKCDGAFKKEPGEKMDGVVRDSIIEVSN